MQLMVLWHNMKQNAHLTINENALCRMKNRVCYYVKWKMFPSNVSAIIPIWKYDYNSPSKPNASTMLMHNASNFIYEILNTTLIQAIQCKYLLKSISKMQLLCTFQYKRMKNAIKSSKTLSLCSKYKRQAQQDTKTKKSNALMEKQKG